QTHHLYELLDAGKIVLIEISATWCAPCWVYHNSQALQDLYAEHGPQGTDRLRVFWIEGDPSTNTNCIYGPAGCNGGSAGDYTQGVAYPILDNADIANTYQIAYYPTLYIICPNKRLYEVDPLSAEDLWEKASTCPVAHGANNAGIFEYATGALLHEICGTQEVNPHFLLTNVGTTPLTQATIELKWNNSTVQTLEWTGDLPTYGEAPVTFQPLSITNTGSLPASISQINYGVGDEDLENNDRIDNFSKAKNFNSTQVLLKIRTDQYGEETYWELRDDEGAVLEFGGNQLVGPNGGGAFPLGTPIGPGTYPSLTIIRDTLELPANGCYSIHFSDAYGDGMCCDFGAGYFRMYNLDDPNVPILSGGEFDNYARRAFGAGVISATSETIWEHNLEIFPNPASSQVHIDIVTPSVPVTGIRIFNAFGQLITVLPNQTGGNTSWQVEVGSWPAGVYFVQTSVGGQVVSRSFVVEK
ncbi:MAG: T9SS type A sorting domain-containing protein, partial [Saprospiraceae bacterium]|nr:T9SS type A sorting domain-containing protein [Saprospiraceae bacterium]